MPATENSSNISSNSQLAGSINNNNTNSNIKRTLDGTLAAQDNNIDQNLEQKHSPLISLDDLGGTGGQTTLGDAAINQRCHRGPVVKRAVEWHQDPIWDYKMSSPVRGYCLIINNVEFSLNLFEHRQGSDKDAHRFKEIFKQLGFEVDCKRNASAEKMKNAFKQKASLCSGKHDALVVILLSHGTESGVYGSDGIEVEINDILSYFDNKKCKAMVNKPKVFIVQACRGRRADYGVPHETQTFFSQPDTQLTSTQALSQQMTQPSRLPRWLEVDPGSGNPTRTDMILCFASHSGFVSTRDEDEGSWLGAALAYHLSREAHHMHIEDIFKMVSRDVRQRRSSEGLKQVLEVNNVGFDKHLYFNPGLTLPANTGKVPPPSRCKKT